MPLTPEERNPVEVFLKSWMVYQKIIKNNYMFHHEISETLQSVISESTQNKRLKIVDLGCGDSSMAIPLLSSKTIASYTGCDLSQPALDIAHGQLFSLHINHKLICEDMTCVIAGLPDASVDVVFSSYAIHHLNTAHKHQIIKEISRVLTVEGRFILIDIFRDPNESRADYMTNYLDTLKSTWTELSEDEKNLVINHAKQYDFPEYADFYAACCQMHGLASVQRAAKFTWHEAWIFTR